MPSEATGIAFLLTLNAKQRHIYAGTASPLRVARDRARNKVARRQRRVNRLRSA